MSIRSNACLGVPYIPMILKDCRVETGIRHSSKYCRANHFCIVSSLNLIPNGREVKRSYYPFV